MQENINFQDRFVWFNSANSEVTDSEVKTRVYIRVREVAAIVDNGSDHFTTIQLANGSEFVVRHDCSDVWDKLIN